MRRTRLNAVDSREASPATGQANDRPADTGAATSQPSGRRARTPESVAALQSRIAEELARRAAEVPDGVIVTADDHASNETTGTAAHGADAPAASSSADPDMASEPTPRQRPSDAVRIAEAIIFAATEPVGAERLAAELPAGSDVAAIMAELERDYAGRGVALVRVAGKWAFRTAGDLGWLLEKHASEERRLSKAAQETLAIISYHQPVTRAEIEEIRGVATSKGTLDVLMETGWIRPRGRRRAPGKPITYGTTDAFLEHFGLASIKDLPGLAELRGAGLLDSNLPPGFKVPEPTDVAALMPDELPLEDLTAQEELALEEAGEDDDAREDDADDSGERAVEPRRDPADDR